MRYDGSPIELARPTPPSERIQRGRQGLVRSEVANEVSSRESVALECLLLQACERLRHLGDAGTVTITITRLLRRDSRTLIASAAACALDELHHSAAQESRRSPWQPKEVRLAPRMPRP
jgi:hypothetical protein